MEYQAEFMFNFVADDDEEDGEGKDAQDMDQ